MKESEPDYDGVLNLDQLRVITGIYYLLNKGKIIYIGRSGNIAKRIIKHINEGKKHFDCVRYKIIPFNETANVESTLIIKHAPELNLIGLNYESSADIPASLSIKPVVNYMRADGKYILRYRVLYRGEMFHILTKILIDEKDVTLNKIVNKKTLKKCYEIADPIAKIVPTIPANTSFDDVKTILLNVTIDTRADKSQYIYL